MQNVLCFNTSFAINHLHVWGGEEAPIDAADALLQGHLKDERRLLMRVETIHLHTASVAPNDHFIDAILGEVNA